MRKHQTLFASLAVLTLVTSMALANPARAADDDSDAMTAAPAATDTAPAASSSATPAHPKGGMQDHVEEHIKTLHDKLMITADQETQWDAVAQAMRDNSQAIHQLIEQRRANTGSMTAVDDLKSYEQITDEHADGLKKLIPVFETLYDSMSDAQKKNADMVFSRYEGHDDAHKKMMHKKTNG